MKIEHQLCSKHAGDEMDAYLVSSTNTEFSTSAETADDIIADGGIVEPVPVKKSLGRHQSDAPEHVKNLGSLAMRRWAAESVFKQRVNLIALKRNETVLRKLQSAVKRGRQWARQCMASSIVKQAFQDGFETARPDNNKLSEVFELATLQDKLVEYFNELKGRGAPDLGSLLGGNQAAVKLFAHILYRSCYALTQDVIYIRPYVPLHGGTPGVGKAKVAMKATAWYGQTNPVNPCVKGEDVASISDLTNPEKTQVLLEHYESEVDWRDRFAHKKDGVKGASNPTDRISPTSNRYGSSLVYVNVDHYARYYADKLILGPTNAKQPGGISLLWVYVHEMTHAHADTPDGVYLNARDGVYKHEVESSSSSSYIDPVYCLIAADVVTYFIARQCEAVTSNVLEPAELDAVV
jgi:hypothetical protein